MRKLIYLDEISERLERVIRFGGKAKNGEHPISAECVLSVLQSLPPVDAVPVRHGRWIDIDTETYTWKIRCNKCGHERSMMSTGQIYPMYCEDCGARMDGKDGDGNG